ncbi:MAG: response regulator [Deltaproteobacteria bacterium]|nr:response regulator [Deltaproteobacteria bacterium]
MKAELVRGAVLVVDDNVDLLDNIEQILVGEGIPVLTARNGREALTVFSENEVSLVITDMKMPGMGGAELLRQLRSARPEITTIVMTAYANEAALAEIRATGPLDVLAKPIPLDRLFELVDLARAPRARVLVLEDDVELRANLSELISALGGCLPMLATTIAQARKIAESVKLDGAVVDVRLPDGNGVAFVEEHGKPSAVPTAVVSGYEKMVPAAGSNVRFFEKPFDSAELSRFLSSWIDRKRPPS